MKQGVGWYSAEWWPEWSLSPGLWKVFSWQSHKAFWKIMFMFSEETLSGKGQNEEVNYRQ